MGSSYRNKKGKLFTSFVFVLISCSINHLLFYDGFFVNCDSPVSENHLLLADLNVNSNSNSDNTCTNANTGVNDATPLLLYSKHQDQIDKLEELVRNLSQLVERLESKFDESKKIESFVKEKGEDDDDDEEGVNDGEVSRVKTTKTTVGGSVSVTKFSPFWSEKFQFMSAVSLDSVATSVNVLPFRDYEGINKYIAVGDDRGRVYVFLRNGDVLVEFYTSCESPVTAMLSYMSSFMNESVVVTGHKNGVILVHRVWETVMGEELSSVQMEKLAPLDLPVPTASPIMILEVHQVGRSKYILSVDEDGKIKVLRENGTLYGLAVPTSRPLVFLKQRLLFLMESGAGSLDLRTMKIRETACEGLNDSVVKNYVFDATERSKAYGFTSSGDLIHVLLLGDVINFKCRVRSRNKFDLDEPLAFQAIKGYLLIIGQQKIYVYNVSTQHYIWSGAPRFTFSAAIEDIKSSFLPSQMEDENNNKHKKNVIPLIASDREKLVILGLGGGYIGMYRSKLPILKGESSTMWVTSPVLFFILFLFGAWQFFAKKKEALTSWGPDDPFSSTPVTSGGSGQGDRSFNDSSSRNADIMDLRNNGMRGPTRRYTSPSRYPVGGGGGGGGGGSSFKANPVDTSSRPTSVESNYRVTSELKFRASNLDSSGFPTRRDMFVNSQVADDGN